MKVHATTECKDTGIHKMKSTEIKHGTGLQIFNPNKPDDNSETTGQFQEVIDADDLQEVPSHDLDKYLPQSENVSARKTHVQTDIVKVHRNEQQSEHLPSNMITVSEIRQKTSSVKTKVQLEKKYKCRYCEKTFTNSTYRSYHEDRKCTHNPNPNLIVCECGKKYKNMSNYKDHRTVFHGDPSRHICKVCGTSFQHQNGLARHKITNH